MLKLLTTAAVIVALATPATAQFVSQGHEPEDSSLELTCTGVRQLFASRQERTDNRYEDDPVEFIRITVDDAGNPTSMSVVHVTRHGNEVSRSDQYDMGAKLRRTRGAIVWSGTYNRNPTVQMSGVLERKGGRWTYTETRFDRGQRSWVNLAVCS